MDLLTHGDDLCSPFLLSACEILRVSQDKVLLEGLLITSNEQSSDQLFQLRSGLYPTVQRQILYYTSKEV